MTPSDITPGTKDISSTCSLETQISSHETPELTFLPGHEKSTSPEKEDILEVLKDNWETDPENARNWPAHKRWGAMLIVRQLIYVIYESLLTH